MRRETGSAKMEKHLKNFLDINLRRMFLIHG